MNTNGVLCRISVYTVAAKRTPTMKDDHKTYRIIVGAMPRACPAFPADRMLPACLAVCWSADHVLLSHRNFVESASKIVRIWVQ